MDEKKSEQRQMERFSLHLEASLVVLADEETAVSSPKEPEAAAALDLTTNDICAGGAFFRTTTPFPVGSEVAINLTLPMDFLKSLSSDSIQVKVKGSVLRQSSDGMAVVFDKGFELISK